MPIRIERTGKVDALTPQFVAFLTDSLGAVSLDEIQNPNERRIDFSCLNGLVAIEMKSLTEGGTERLKNLTQELREQEDWPVFYGSWPIGSIAKNLDNPKEITTRINDRIGRSIVNHLKKADDQLAAYTKTFSRKIWYVWSC